MFCPKCGQQNPETGKFCRSCGTDLGNVSSALSGQPSRPAQVLNHKGKPISYESSITKMFTGLAFLIVAGVLGYTGIAGGKFWWFWMLIPAFGSLGAGIAQHIQIKKAEKDQRLYSPANDQRTIESSENAALPSPQSELAATDRVPSKYKTGDLVPPSVTDNTTRHLELDSEGQTMTLPKK
ncbi:MAG: zinc-ribbon domain-containing protein [Pyrinomonadaceae bacterium]